MFETLIHSMPAVGSLAIGSILMAHVKSKGSSVLLHHATHGRLHSDHRTNHALGEAVGIASLAVDFDHYRMVHGKHHAFPSFAQAGLDMEADDLIAMGFRPGRSKQELWRLFWMLPLNPAWHARQSWARLRANFISGPPVRRRAAWRLWVGTGALAAATGALPAFGGVLLTLLVAGNIGSYLELVSRHMWAVTPPQSGRARQLALSRWRLPSPIVPERWTPTSAASFLGSVLMKTLVRVAALPGDLPHHAAHHLTWDGGVRTGEPAWTDAALAYSDRLRADPGLREHVYGSLLEAVGAWIDALAKEPAIPAVR